MGSHLADVLYSVTDLQVAHGRGAWITTTDGSEFLDLTSGIGVANTGHAHPAVVEAVREQAGRFLHAQVNCYRHDRLEPLAARLAEVTPAGIDRFFFATSGAEATEAAVKLAKQATGRSQLVTFRGAFHGRTHLAMAMTTSKSTVRDGHGPLPAGVLHAPYPYPFLTGEDEETAIDRCLAEFDLLLTREAAPSQIACVVIEPVLGEGGYVPAPTRFLRGLADRCRAHGILFVADEVQTGFGRTGRMFASEHHGVVPDVLIMAKGIASGFPMSAIGTTEELNERWPKGSHGGTYGGNPMACAASLATLDILTADGFLDHARAVGERLHDGLGQVASASPSVAEVRGLGCMLATEIVDAQGQPDPGGAAAILQHLRDQARVIAMSCGPYGSTIRWIPPLITELAEVDVASEGFAAAVADHDGR